MDYVNAATLVDDSSAVVHDRLLLEACTKGDIGVLRLLLCHWTSNPNVVLLECISNCSIDALTAVLEHQDTEVTYEALILACKLARTEAISLMLRDKRFDPTSNCKKYVAEIVNTESIEALIVLLSDMRLRTLIEYTLLLLIEQDKIEMFEALIAMFPYSSIELLLASTKDTRLMQASLRCSRTEHKKELLSRCMCPPVNITTLSLIIKDSRQSVIMHLLLLGIRNFETDVINLALNSNVDLVCKGSECPLSHALNSKSEDNCNLLVRHAGLVDCQHLSSNSMLAVRLGYMQTLQHLLPILLLRSEESSEVVVELLSSNHESKVLLLIDCGYKVHEYTLVRCLQLGYYTTIRAVRSKQAIDFSYNNYQLLRIAARIPSNIAFDTLFLK